MRTERAPIRWPLLLCLLAAPSAVSLALPQGLPSGTPGRGGHCTKTHAACTSARDCPSGEGCCGDGVVDPGETCDDGNTEDGDDCPSTCRVDACAAGTRTLRTSVTYAAPPRTTIAGLVVFVDYPESRVTKPRFEATPGIQNNTRDLGYGFRDAALKVSGLPETLTTATFTLCDGAEAPPASAFTCKVLDASDDQGNVRAAATLTCAVVVK